MPGVFWCTFPLPHLVKIGVKLESERGVVPRKGVYQDVFAHSVICRKLTRRALFLYLLIYLYERGSSTSQAAENG